MLMLPIARSLTLVLLIACIFNVACARHDWTHLYIADAIVTTGDIDKVEDGKINPERFSVTLDDGGSPQDICLYAYAADFRNPDDTKRKEARNLLQSKLMALSNDAVERHFNDVFLTQDTTNMALGVTALGFSTAGAIATNGASQIFSGIATGVLGGKALAAEEIYSDTLPEIMVQRVRAERSKLAAELLELQATKSIHEYSVGAAVADALRYHHLGSFQTALALISDDIQNAANQANQRAANVRKDIGN